MKKAIFVLCIFLVTQPLLLAANEPVDSAGWHPPLYLGNHDYWRQRIPVIVGNNTDQDLTAAPVTFNIADGPKALPLTGTLVESIRVTNAKGEQLMYRVNGPDGGLLEKGPAPKGSSMTIPLDCLPRSQKTCFIYFDNPSAWPVGDYFLAERDIANGGFEKRDKYGPRAWKLDWSEDARSVTWSNKGAHSGNRCLKIKVDRITNTKPTSKSRSKSAYGASQMLFYLVPGATYTIEAWIKGENISGLAGLSFKPVCQSLDVADFESNPVRLTAPKGTNDWSSHIRRNFVAPAKSDVLRIETFMTGTGTLWIDDIRISSSVDYNIETTVLDTQTAPVIERGTTDQWYKDNSDSAKAWPLRACIKVPNFSKKPLADIPIHVDIEQLLNRLHAEVDEHTVLQLTDGTQAIDFLRQGNGILFKQSIPAGTVRSFYLYFNPRQAAGASASSNEIKLPKIAHNLIQNPDFDTNQTLGWERFGKGIAFETSIDGAMVNRSLKIDYLSEEADNETGQEIEEGCGLKQIVPARPGKRYFFAARVKDSATLKHSFAVRATFLDARGKRIGGWKELSIHQDRYMPSDWRWLTMSVQAPDKTRSTEISLTKTGSGTAWFDDIIFVETIRGTTGPSLLERKAVAELSGFVIWQENPIVKVFPDDLPKSKLEGIRISAARNETEPIQLALRSPRKNRDLTIKVLPPKNKDGKELDQIEVGIVGYVPIDTPSSYYQDYEKPYWQMKIAQGRFGCDGWAGWWPDPILPVQTFDLPADETHAAWIEISVPMRATAGTYKGSIQILSKKKVLKKVPLEVTVRSFQLPDASNVQAIYDLRFRDRQRYGTKRTQQQIHKAVWKYMKQHRISPETILPEPDWTIQNGTVTADFSAFDAAASVYFDELKFQLSYTPWEFHLFGWAHPPRDKFGQAPYPGISPYEDADRSKLRPEFKAAYQSALRTYWEHMKGKGWADKVIMYISDEPNPEPKIEQQMKALCDMIHEVDPDIPIYVSVWWHRPEFDGYIDIWGVSHRGGAWGHPVPSKDLERIKGNGDRVIFTTDGMVCTDTPYLAFERMLPYFCFKYGASAYEFWGSNWQTINPFDYGWHPFHRQSNTPGKYYWMRYPNGDGYIIYPGPPVGVDHLVPSIRLKQAREGVEDYEYLHLLKQLIEQRKSEGAATFEAEAALAGALDLVNIPTADGRYSTGYLRDPDKVLKVRDSVALAIEKLLSQKQ